MVRFIFNNFNDPGKFIYSRNIHRDFLWVFHSVRYGMVFKTSSLSLQQMHNPVGKSDKEREHYVTIL